MVAATKNKRGRPVSARYVYPYSLRDMNNGDLSDRTIRNKVNAEFLTDLLHDRKEWALEDFFLTKEGMPKHTGIAEQLGRMLDEGIVTDDQAIEIALECVNAYNNGATAKEIEKSLRQHRIGERARKA